MVMQTEMEMERRAYARVGLLGNPSDVYGGRAVSFAVAGLWATVRLRPSDQLLVQPHPRHDLVAFPSLHALRWIAWTAAGTTAACGCCWRSAGSSTTTASTTESPWRTRTSPCHTTPTFPARQGSPAPAPSSAPRSAASWISTASGTRSGSRSGPTSSSTPRRSSALSPGFRTASRRSTAALFTWILARSIWISWAMECTRRLTLICSPLCISSTPNSSVRQRWLDGDEFIISSMKEVAQLAYDGHNVLLQKNYTELARLMNRNFDLRRQMFGDDALGEVNIKMVEVARSVGAASKFTGSGGAVVALCPDGDAQAELLKAACQQAGFAVEPIEVAPSALTEEPIKVTPSQLTEEELKFVMG
ncbi:unnamed protein product [Triticum turgidum subsp. durum]|uniref:GHMP kinase C-terminal domain-containing protein n=1 Tax=Triticum turgidum subsp. durum TaxID=4567 RepID=A0A9R0YEV3_TRITD|nr:unnamed protein product [Triticum turgidum subsp. durum]